MTLRHAALSFVLAAALAPSAAGAEQQTQPPPQTQRPPPPQAPFDEARARHLYVSNDPRDHAPGRDFAGDIEDRLATEKRYAEASKGKSTTFRSSGKRSSAAT